MVALLAAALCARANADAHDRERPTSFTFTAESLRLPGGERLGLIGGSLLFGLGGDWWLGPAVHGAASGERGGLFVGGAEVRRSWRFGRERVLASFAAGGGGGAAAPVGGGLMLRPAIVWLHDIGPMRAGVSWSRVAFPSGDIASSQFGLVLAWEGVFRFAEARRAGETVRADARSGLGFDRLLATATAYRPDDAAHRAQRIGLAGVRLERIAATDHDSGLVWSVEAAGAATDGAGGYMELLGGAGWRFAPWPDSAPRVRVGARIALGLAGGGAVPTGGGGVGKAALTIELPLTRTLATGLDVGALRAFDSGWRAPSMQWWLAAALEPLRGGAGAPAQTEARLARTEWTPTLQHHLRAQRRDGTRARLDTIGIKLTRYRGEHLYVTGQAHSAYAGGAGAYSVGLIGVGSATGAPGDRWRFGIEGLIGAAGGGGVDTAGGALLQGVAWAGLTASPSSQWRIGVGAVRAPRGALATPLVELAWTWAFAQAAP